MERSKLKKKIAVCGTFIFFCFAIASFALLAEEPPEKTDEEIQLIVSKAVELYREDRLFEAKELFEKVLRYRPEHSMAIRFMKRIARKIPAELPEQVIKETPKTAKKPVKEPPEGEDRKKKEISRKVSPALTGITEEEIQEMLKAAKSLYHRGQLLEAKEIFTDVCRHDSGNAVALDFLEKIMKKMMRRPLKKLYKKPKTEIREETEKVAQAPLPEEAPAKQTEELQDMSTEELKGIIALAKSLFHRGRIAESRKIIEDLRQFHKGDPELLRYLWNIEKELPDLPPGKTLDAAEEVRIAKKEKLPEPPKKKEAKPVSKKIVPEEAPEKPPAEVEQIAAPSRAEERQTAEMSEPAPFEGEAWMERREKAALSAEKIRPIYERPLYARTLKGSGIPVDTRPLVTRRKRSRHDDEPLKKGGITERQKNRMIAKARSLYYKGRFKESRDKFLEVREYSRWNPIAMRYLKKIAEEIPEKTAKKNIGELVFEARTLYEEGKYVEARERFLEIVREFPSDGNAARYAAKHVGEDAVEEAIDDRLIRIADAERDARSPVEAEYAVDSAASMYEEGEYDEAIRKIDEAVVKYPGDVQSTRYAVRYLKDVHLRNAEELQKKKRETEMAAAPYLSSTFYSGARSKDYEYAMGTRLTLVSDRDHRFEGEVEFSETEHIQTEWGLDQFQNNAKTGLKDTRWNTKQFDFTFAYTNTVFTPAAFRAGAHYINFFDFEKKVSTQDSATFFTGAEYEFFGNNRVGLSGYYSSYYDRMRDDPGLEIYQFNPKFGVSIFDRGGSSLYSELKGYYILKAEDGALGEDKDFVSVELSLSYTFKKILLKGSSWYGKQSYAVTNDGFDVENSPEIYKGGFGGAIRYAAIQDANFNLSFDINYFDDAGKSARASTLVFSIDCPF
ncbi:MAG: hypothetical protein ABIJ27_06230 [Candidatus Omnitrophota bacterium]